MISKTDRKLQVTQLLFLFREANSVALVQSFDDIQNYVADAVASAYREGYDTGRHDERNLWMHVEKKDGVNE